MMEGTINTLLEAIPLPAVLVGPNERIDAANGLAETLLGQGLQGRHFTTVLRQPAVLDAIESCLRDHQPLKARYLSNAGAQDTVFEVSCAAVEGEAGMAALLCFEDVTPLEQIGQMRRDFVANVSHELRSPLTALLGFIETLQGPARNDPDATERFLVTMQEEAGRMERLVKDLLSLSRLEAQERMRPRDQVDLVALLRTVIHANAPLLHDARVTCDLQADMAALHVAGDADQLQQVFTNLIENAVKYGGPDKVVTIRIQTSEDHRGPSVSVSVTDQGPGIEDIHIPRLTERFYRIDSHRSREMGGTGLGLAIVKHVVSRHRGRMRIHSELGQGSTFQVILPQGAESD